MNFVTKKLFYRLANRCHSTFFLLAWLEGFDLKVVLRGVYIFKGRLRGLVEDVLDCCVSVSSQAGRADGNRMKTGLLEIKLRQADRI